MPLYGDGRSGTFSATVTQYGGYQQPNQAPQPTVAGSRMFASVTVKAESLVDDFTTLDTAKWPFRDAGVAVTAGQLTFPSGASLRTVNTDVNRYDLQGSYMGLQIVAQFTAGQNVLLVGNALLAAENRIIIGPENGNLLMREVAGGVVSDTTLPYDATAHRWVRLEHDGTNLLWRTSPDGSTWTTRRTKVTTVPLGSLRIDIEANPGASGTGTAIIDNFNVVSASSAATASGGITLDGSATPTANSSASGGITLGGSPSPAAVAAGSGSITLGGTSTAAARATGPGSITLGGSASAGAMVGASGTITLGGSARTLRAYAVTSCYTLTEMQDWKARGGTHVLLQVYWDRWLTSTGGTVVSSAVTEYRGWLSNARTAGLRVIGEMAIQYPHTYAQTAIPKFRMQSGTDYTDEPVRDWVWTAIGRTYVAEFLSKAFAALNQSTDWDLVDTMRVGGGPLNELQYPPSHHASGSGGIVWWSHGAAAQTGTGIASGLTASPVPGSYAFQSTPTGTVATTQDTTLMNWHIGGLTNFMAWMIAQHRAGGWSGNLHVLHPSFGVRYEVGTGDLNYRYEAAQGTSWGVQMDAYPDANVHPWQTWADAAAAADPTSNMANKSPVQYMRLLADARGKTLAGAENAAGSTDTALTRIFTSTTDGAIGLGYAVYMHVSYPDLVAGTAGTLSNITTQIAARPASGSIAADSSAAVASGGLTLGGSATAQARAAGPGALALSGTATATVTASASGSLTLGGTETARAAATAAGTLTLNGTVTAGGTASASGALTLGGTAVPTGSATPATATGALSLTGNATARVAAVASGVIVLSGSSSATASTTTGGTVTLGGVATARVPATAAGLLTLTGLANAQAVTTLPTEHHYAATPGATQHFAAVGTSRTLSANPTE